MLQIYLAGLALILILLILLNRQNLLQKLTQKEKIYEKKQKIKIGVQLKQAELQENRIIEKQEFSRPKSKKEELISLAQINGLIKKAELLMAKEEYAEAEKFLIQILALDQENFVVNSLLALLYLKTKAFLKAEAIYRKLLEVKTHDPALYTNLGLAFYNQGKYQEALESYSFAAKLDPHKAPRHTNVGQVYFVMRRFDEALKHFQEAVRLAPRHQEYLFMLADTYREKGDLPKAKEVYNKILDRDPYNLDAHEEIKRLKAMGY